MADALAINPQGLDGLRFQAASRGDKASLRAAAQQFESYFLQLMLRAMRQTVAQDGLFDSEETRMFSDMFDQQVAQNIAKGRGLGLADMLVSQLEAQIQAGSTLRATPRPYELPSVGQSAPVQQTTLNTLQDAADSPAVLNRENFVGTLWPYAVQAADQLGIAPHALLAHAALETGWGERILKHPNGSSSHNLFNLKAGSQWRGPTVQHAVDEYAHGKLQRVVASFRAYASFAESFADYVGFLRDNPRYVGVLNQDGAGFARGLQQSGFATDPAYGDKLLRVMSSVTSRMPLAG